MSSVLKFYNDGWGVGLICFAIRVPFQLRDFLHFRIIQYFKIISVIISSLLRLSSFCGVLTIQRGFPGGSVVKNSPAMQETQETQVRSLGWEDPLKEGIATNPLAQRSKHLPAMQETRVRSLGGEDPLEKETATHSSILAWRIPWREEPGGLQSIRLQKNWGQVKWLSMCAYICCT